MDTEKLDRITKLVNRYAEMTRSQVEDFITADWNDPAHTTWLETATDNEIADWVIAGQ